MNILSKTSIETYLQKEKEAEHKSEYHNGEVLAMAGASENHNLIVSNMLFLMNRCLWESSCKVYPSDMLLRLEKCNRYVYPDIMLVCESAQIEKHQGIDVLLNPLVIVEVLSESTSKYDLGDKMKCYIELESLQEYIMIDSEQRNAFSYTRKDEQEWLLKIMKESGDKINIRQCEIELGEIYRRVSF